MTNRARTLDDLRATGDGRRAAAVVEHAARLWMVDAQAILDRRRGEYVDEARGAVAWVLREGDGMLVSTIGRLLGRDHSSVSTLVQRTARRMRANREYRVLVGELIGAYRRDSDDVLREGLRRLAAAGAELAVAAQQIAAVAARVGEAAQTVEERGEALRASATAALGEGDGDTG